MAKKGDADIPKKNFLEAFPCFHGLLPSELDSVKSFLSQKSFTEGQAIVTEGDEVEILYLIVSGVVKVFKTSTEGKELILWIAKPGNFINDISVFHKGLSPVSAVALEQSLVYGISKGHMRFIVEKYPVIATNMLKMLADKVHSLISLADDLCFQTVTGRVIRLLLEYARDQSSNANPKQRFTQQQMAAQVGTVREMINRSLKALEAEGLIRMKRHQIVILDKERLTGRL